jgi:Domain of unknown function (DUF4070)
MMMIMKIFYHFNLRVPAPVRTMFWNILKETWRIDPRLISRAVSMLVQYWHYYDFSSSAAKTPVQTGSPARTTVNG